MWGTVRMAILLYEWEWGCYMIGVWGAGIMQVLIMLKEGFGYV